MAFPKPDPNSTPKLQTSTTHQNSLMGYEDDLCRTLNAETVGGTPSQWPQCDDKGLRLLNGVGLATQPLVTLVNSQR